MNWRKGLGTIDWSGLGAIYVICILAAVVFWLAMDTATNGGMAPPLDDTYIYFQYARQIAEGQPFSYIPGDGPTTGATGFLYPFLLAPGFLLGLDGGSILVYAFALNALFLFITAVLVYLLTRLLTGRYLAVLASLLVTLSGPVLWGFFSLMEIGLVSAVIMLVAFLFAQEHQYTLPWKTLLAASLLPLSRPEGVAMAGLVVALAAVRLAPLAAAWAAPQPGTGFVAHRAVRLPHSSPLPRQLLGTGALALPLAMAAGYLLLLHDLSGSLSTNTFLSKAVHTIPLVPWFDKVGLVSSNTAVLMQNPFGLNPTYLPIILFPLLVLGLARHLGMEVGQRRPGVGFLSLGIFFIMVLSASQLPSAFAHHFRYIMAIFPLALVFVVAGLGALSRFSREGSLLSIGLAVLVLVLTVVNTPKWVQIYAENTGDIFFQQVSLARWLRDNIPTGSTIALNDAGAIAYYGEHPVYDMVGLVTNGAALPYRHGTGAVFERIKSLPRAERPEYYAIYPHWFAFPHGDFLTEVFRTQLLRRSISGGSTVVVYRADYSVAEGNAQPTMRHDEGGRWEMVDALNVAELEDEARHDYQQFDLMPRGEGEVTVLRQWRHVSDEGADLLDGGRVVLGAEEFTVDTRPGLPLKLVMRTDAAFPVTLRVYADGRYAGEWSYPQVGGAWTEPSFTVPADLVQEGGTRLRLELASYSELTGHDYAPFHYWFYQPPSGTVPGGGVPP